MPTRALLPVVALLAAQSGCWRTIIDETVTVCATDLDGDGALDAVCAGGVDCDPTSSLCSTSCVDTDLDGVWDCKDACVDGDGDGYGTGSACLGTDCDDTTQLCTTDCVDLDADQVWDCRDNCIAADQDADGYLGCGSVGLPDDCNDDLGNIHPGASEICGNTIDEDCLGGDLSCALALNPLGLTDDGTLINVSNAVFAITFDRNSNGVPSSLRILGASGQNVLYTTYEKNERLAAVGDYNNYFSWDETATPAITVLQSGPAAVRLRIAWTSGNAGQMTGVSQYSLYPDGRIHRDERVQINVTGTGWFTAYLTLSVAHWNRLEWDAGSSSGSYAKRGNLNNTSLSVYDGLSTDRGYLCAADTVAGDVVGWSHYVAGTVFPYGFRLWEIGQGSTQSTSALICSEWIRSTTVPMGAYYGHALMNVGATGACSSVTPAAYSFSDPPTLNPTVGSRVIGDPGDDDADGFNEGAGAHHLSAGGGKEIQLSVTATTPAPTSVLEISNIDLSFEPVIDRNGTRLSNGRDYLIQIPATRDQAVIFLALPLDEGTTLGIHAP